MTHDPTEWPKHSRLWWWWYANFGSDEVFWREWGKCMDALAATSRAIAEKFPEDDELHERLDALAERLEEQQ